MDNTTQLLRYDSGWRNRGCCSPRDENWLFDYSAPQQRRIPPESSIAIIPKDTGNDVCYLLPNKYKVERCHSVATSTGGATHAFQWCLFCFVLFTSYRRPSSTQLLPARNRNYFLPVDDTRGSCFPPCLVLYNIIFMAR